MPKKKILLVDDEADTRALVSMVLEEAGFDVGTVNNGDDSIVALKKKKYDLVLLDILMPGMSAKEVLEKMQKIKSAAKTKVSYFTVVDQPAAKKLKLLDFDNVVDYIQKPFDNTELVQRIKKILRHC